MNKYLKILFQDGVIYGLASVITKLVHIFLVPLYSNHLSQVEYGQYSLINSLLVVANILIFFSLESAVSKYYYMSDDTDKKRKVFSTWIYFMWLLSIASAFILWIFKPILSEYVFNSTEHEGYISLVSINTLFFGLQYIIVVYFRYQRRPWAAVIVSLLLTVLTLTFNYYFVSYEQLGIKGILYSHVGVSIIFSIIGIYFFRKILQLQYFDFSLLKEMIKFSAPLVPASLLRFVLLYSIVYFVDYYVGKKQLGLYQVGSTISGLIRLFVLAFMIPWNTLWYSISKEPNAKDIYSDVVNVFFVLGMLGAVTIFMFGDYLILLFSNAKYSEAANILGLLAINHILMGLPQITLVGAAINGDNRPYLKAIICGCIVTIVSLLVLTPTYGLYGACLGLIIGSLVVQLVLVVLVNRVYKVNYNYMLLGIVLLVALLLNYSIVVYSSWFTTLVRVVVYTIYALLTILFLKQSLSQHIRVLR